MFGFAPFSTRPFSGLRDPRIFLDGEASVDVSLVFVIRVATREFATEPTDTIEPSQPYFGTLAQPLSVTRSILSGGTIGRFSQVSGEIDITNADGFYDFLINGYAVDGRQITVKVGELGADSATFQTIFSGPGSDWTVQEDVVRIEVQDNSYKLSVLLQQNTYAGTGGLEGGSDLSGKPKPLAFGDVSNVPAVLVDPTTLLFQVHDGPIRALNVFDRAVVLTFDADYPNSAALLAATVASGHYAMCLAEGLFRLGALQDNSDITADVQGDNTGGVLAETAADIVRRIIVRAGVLIDPDDLYLPSFTQVNLDQPAPLGYFVGVDASNATIGDVFADIMGSVGGWAGFRRDGRFYLGIFSGPADTPQLSFKRIDERDIKRAKSPISPAVAKWRIGWGRNWKVQSQIAGAATDARRTFVAEEYRFASSNATIEAAIRRDHPFTKDPDPIRAYFRDQTDAQTEADRLQALYGAVRALYTVDLGTEPFAIELGDTANVTFNRWDLTSGRNLVLVQTVEDASRNSVQAGLWG